MSVDRAVAAELAAGIAETYARLESDLIADVGRRLADGIEAPDWQVRKTLAAGQLRRWADTAVQRVDVEPEVARALTDAYRAGGVAATAELASIGGRPAGAGRVETALPGAGAISRLIARTVDTLSSTRLPIVRSISDVYQKVIVRAGTVGVLAGTETRRQAAQRAYVQLTRNGVSGFVDRSGKNWSLSGYVDMATRTATAQAAVEGHLDRMGDAGLDLVIVSDASGECERCRPWEGKVLVRGGAGGKRTIERPSEVDDDPVTVRIEGSVSEAIGAGLLHPNCRHSLSAYLPGLTRTPTNTADPEGDRARQRLRALERRKRELARSIQAAEPFGGKMPAELRTKLTKVNKDIREHVKATGLRRKPERERIDLGMTAADKRRLAVEQPDTALQAGIKSGIADRRQLGGGISAKTERVTFNDGGRAVYKRATDAPGIPPRDQTDAEVLGASVANAVGVRVPDVVRASNTEVYMTFVDGRTLAELDRAVFDRARSSDDGLRLGLSDLLMGNTDRNRGNLIINERDELYGIDHGSAFQWHPEYNDPSRVPVFSNDWYASFGDSGGAGWADNPLTLADVAELRGRLERLEPEFARLGRGDWFVAMLARLSALGEHATGARNVII
jgi:hypothetical protein